MLNPFPLVRRFRAGRLSRAFAQACEVRGVRPKWIGLEHEFLVFDAQLDRVDFRSVVHGLGLGRRDLVPGDRYAYRLKSGSVITADTTEAEIATPPADLRPGFSGRLDAWAAGERDHLAGCVEGLTLRGDSTHLNVTLPGDVDADLVASIFATRFAPGLMLLMDRITSPGLLVRPRPYRLELGGEYVVGSALRAALAYAAGATLAIVAWLRGPRFELPPSLDIRLERGVMRYGWYVDRNAFGIDLYEGGRSASLRTVDGDRAMAQQVLERGWRVARDHLAPFAGVSDLRDADELVGGSQRLPIERSPGEQEHDVARARRPRSPFGELTKNRRRPFYDLAPVMLTWQAAVFLAADRHRQRAAFVAIPGGELATFLNSLRAGAVDTAIGAYLALPPAGRRLAGMEILRPGLYDDLGLRATLLAPERDYWGQPIRYRLPHHRVPASSGLVRA